MASNGSLRGTRGHAYLRLVRRVGHRRWFMALGRRLLHPLDRLVQRLSGGRVSSVAPSGIPVLVLEVAGRRSGRLRSVPLVYLEDGPRLLVVASNWGTRRHPSWSDNLRAAREASVRIRGRVRRVAAREVDADTKRALWPRLLEVWPAWREYEAMSGRDLRVFALEPTREENASPAAT